MRMRLVMRAVAVALASWVFQQSEVELLAHDCNADCQLWQPESTCCGSCQPYDGGIWVCNGCCS